MVPRPRLAPPSRRRWSAIVLLAVLVVAAGALVAGELRTADASPEATVTLIDEDGTVLGRVEVRVADTFEERYTGLSDTESLGPDEGMLFVHGSEGERTYVMRDMAFPIDIVFIGADRRITTIHHAAVEEPPLTHYRGEAKWVLEVPYRWTVDHGVAVGDRVRIDRPG